MRWKVAWIRPFAHHAVQQPVGHVLAADAQRCTVFHEADVVDVGHLGAAHALVHPAHHIAQNALRVVVEFLLDFSVAPVRAGGDGDGEQAGQQVVAYGIEVGFSSSIWMSLTFTWW